MRSHLDDSQREGLNTAESIRLANELYSHPPDLYQDSVSKVSPIPMHKRMSGSGESHVPSLSPHCSFSLFKRKREASDVAAIERSYNL
jgi:hypothetical protein